MKLLKHGLPVLLLAAGVGFTSTASATLWNRGGGMIYDDVLNITWLANSNLGAGSSYDNGASATDGLMTWDSAVAWASNLTYGGYSDWRLPVMTDLAAPTYSIAGTDGCNFALPGTLPLKDCGYAIKTKQGGIGSSPFLASGTPFSEMAYLWIDELAYGASLNTSLFSPLLGGSYWFANEDVSDSSGVNGTSTGAWGLGFGGDNFSTLQSVAPKAFENGAWAVRSGDVTPPPPLPEPGSMTLLGAGLMGWLGARVRRRV
jgi:hypothetical protein